MNEKVLITGVTGFLGSRFVEMLNGKYEIIGIGRNIKKGKDLEKKLSGFKFIPCNLEDKIEVFDKLDKYEFDIVVHGAALSSPWGKYKEFYKANVIATQNVIEYAKSKKINRFIFISSPSIYTSKIDRFDIREEDHKTAKHYNNYIKTKEMAEKLVFAKSNDELKIIIIRPQGIFGPKDSSVIPRIIDANERGGVPIFNKNMILDLTYVDNVVHAIDLSICAKDEAYGRVYNITNDEPINVYDLINKIFGKLNISLVERRLKLNVIFFLSYVIEFFYKILPLKTEPVLTPYKVLVLAKSRTLNVDNAKKHLGYAPIVSMEEGINNYISWKLENEAACN